MSTRDELAGVLSQHEHIVLEGRDVIAGAPEDIAETVHAEGWRKKPDDEALWDLADELLDGLNVYDENPPSLSEYIADRVRALMDRGQ